VILTEKERRHTTLRAAMSLGLSEVELGSIETSDPIRGGAMPEVSDQFKCIVILLLAYY
jgi:hypothetical protein